MNIAAIEVAKRFQTPTKQGKNESQNRCQETPNPGKTLGGVAPNYRSSMAGRLEQQYYHPDPLQNRLKQSQRYP